MCCREPLLTVLNMHLLLFSPSESVKGVVERHAVIYSPLVLEAICLRLQTRLSEVLVRYDFIRTCFDNSAPSHQKVDIGQIWLWISQKSHYGFGCFG